MMGFSGYKVFTLDEIEAWTTALLLVTRLSEDPELLVRCHELTHAMGIYLRRHPSGWSTVDGKFGLVDHSWLVASTPGRHTILDVYAVGSLPMVQLVDLGSLGVREARQYVEGATRDDIDISAINALLRSMEQ